MNVVLRLATMVVVLAPLMFAQPSKKPDLSGTWQLDPAMTRFGEVPPPKSLVIQIAHKEPNIKILLVTETKKEELRELLELTTDGRQHPCATEGPTCTASARWDQWSGSRLIVEINRADNSLSRRFTLGKERKILTTILTVKDKSRQKKAYEFFNRQGS